MIVLRADAAQPLPIRAQSVQAVVTSPPYPCQRIYGDHPAEGGREPTLDLYVRWLTGVLHHQVRPTMDRRALLWLNLGDKANGSGGAGGDWSKAPGGPGIAHRQQRGRGNGPGKFADDAYEEGSYVDVGGAVIRSLLNLGWRLRLPIVWDKGRDAPESLRHVMRPRWAHEMIYLLTPWPRGRKGKAQHRPRFYPTALTETGSVWHFRPGGSGPAHLAPFPDELARRCILPSTLPGDIVLDPFHGSGTTARVAEAHGRRGIGVDLYAGRPIEELEAHAWSPRQDLALKRDAAREASRSATG